MVPLFGAALLTGLTGGVHCVGMCGGFAAASAARGGSWPWHLGRISTYAALGAIAGSLGLVLPGPTWLPAALAAFLILYFAARMAGIGGTGGLHLPMPRALVSLSARLARQEGVGARYLFGVATGLLPCGLIYTALALAVAAASPAQGAVVMAIFGASTVPVLAGLGALVRGLATRSTFARRGLAVVVATMGLWSISMRVQHPAHADPGAEPGETSVVAKPSECPMHSN